MAADHAVRVAVVSHSYVVAVNRGKLAALAQDRNLEILSVVPDRWVNRDIDHLLDCEAPTPGVRMVPCGVTFPGYGALFLYSPLPTFKALKAFQPSLIHVEEEPWSLAALELTVMSAALGSKLIVFTWENLDRHLPPPLRLVRRAVLGRANAVVAGNREAKRLLGRHGFERPIAVVPQLGVDPDLFHPGAGPQEGEFVIGYVGRLVAQKGLGLLVEATARMPKHVRLLIVGSGPWKGELLARAAAAGLTERLELCEAVGHRAVPDHLRRMNVLVLPSRTTPVWKEQFGHVLVEAMACGVPVVGSDSGAIPEVIGDSGLIVEEGDADSLARALTRVMQVPGLSHDLAARGRARAVNHYSNAAVGRSLADFWRKVVVHGQ